MPEPVNKQVEVMARTQRGQITPVLVTWNQKSYTISDVAGRKAAHINGDVIETITVNVMDVKKMQLEFDHRKKCWTLLQVD